MGTKTKVILNRLEYEAETFDETEAEIFNQAWESMVTFYNDQGEPYQILDAAHKADLLKACMVMKSFYDGARFTGGFPREGEFGVRWPQVEDLVGATDSEWGATTLGVGDWTAGQYAWIHSAAQNSATYAAAANIILRDSGGAQEWGFMMFGVRSFNLNPVVKDVIINAGQELQSVQEIEEKLRGSSARIALFDENFFFWPKRSFRIGVTVRTSDPDQIYPIGFVIMTGTRARDVSYNRPTAA